MYISNISTGGGVIPSLGRGQAINQGKLGNPNLGWEEKKEWNLGVDYSFFEGRLYGKFDYYRREVDNLLFSVKVPQHLIRRAARCRISVVWKVKVGSSKSVATLFVQKTLLGLPA